MIDYFLKMLNTLQKMSF